MNEPFIRSVQLSEDVNYTSYPFSIPAVKEIESVQFTSPVTFFVGENGSGKSTLIESIAIAAGFNAEGGTKNYHFTSHDSTSELSKNIRLIRGARREKSGYFLRAESFYTTANYIDSGTYNHLGSSSLTPSGKRIHEQSHGEAFLSIINEFKTGLFIFDEPESALSPQRQLALIVKIKELVKQGSQFIIATHSPILLALPEATIYSLSESGVASIKYQDAEHVTLTKDFLNNPTQYLDHLLRE